MAEMTSVVVGALGVVEGIAKLTNTFDVHGTSKHLENLLGELTILQHVMAESVLMMEDLRSPPRYSAVIALARCEELQHELESSLQFLGLTSTKKSKVAMHIRFTSREDRVNRVYESFKSAVLLVRDIVTDSLTHEYLKGVYESSVKGKSTRPVEPDIESTSTNDGASQQWSSTSNPREFQTIKPIQYLDPTQRLSLFDATISYIVDMDTEDEQQASTSSTCACGRRRQGIWFPVRGKWDSGSDTEWISEDVIRRAKLDQFIFEVPAKELKMFGVSFTFNRMITLNWQLKNEETSFTSDFWVAHATEFDLIIGEPWMAEHGYGTLETNTSRKRPSFFGMLKLGRKSRGEDTLGLIGRSISHDANKLADQKKREAAKAESNRANASIRDEQRRAEEQHQWNEYRRRNSTLVTDRSARPFRITGSGTGVSSQPTTPPIPMLSMLDPILSASSQDISVTSSNEPASTSSSTTSTNDRTITLGLAQGDPEEHPYRST